MLLEYYNLQQREQNFGYFGGGRLGPADGSAYVIDRIDYANDTATASAKGPLTATRSNSSATGNQSLDILLVVKLIELHYSVDTDRLDYSNDKDTASEKGVLGQQKHSHGPTGNADFGYSGGGSNSVATTDCSIRFRVDYSNDTANQQHPKVS